MKIASYLNFIKNLRSPAKNFFLYGSNTDLIALRIYFLKKKLQQLHGMELIQRDISDILDAARSPTANLFASIEQKKVVNFYTSNAMKSFDAFDRLYSRFDDFLIWQATSVYFQSPLVKAIDKHPQIASIPNYHLEQGELKYYTQHTFQADAITCDDNVLQYIISFHENDLVSLPSNLQNMTLSALVDKQITFETACNICQSRDNEDIKACAIAFVRGDRPQFLSTLASLGDLSAMVIPLARFISRVLQNSLQTGSGNYQKNLHQLTLAQVAKILNGLLNIEHQIKTTGVMHETILKSQLCTLMDA